MKEIKTFKKGDHIPSNAKFLATGHDPEIMGQVFYYEVPIVDETAQAKREQIMEQVEHHAGLIIDHLNQRTGKKFSTKSKETLKLIRARLNDGYSPEDLIRVIDNMTAAWLEDQKMCNYLRPSTLFQSSKFEGYLNTKASAQEAADAFAELEEYC